MALPHRGRRRFAPPTIFPMLQTLFEAITPCAKTLYEKWRCRIAAGGVSRRQTFFQCFKLCLKLSYHTRKANLCEKWRCRFAAGGVSRRQAFFQCFKLCLKLLYHTRKANLCEKWRCRFAAGGVSRRQPFFQCFKLCLKLFYHIRNRITLAKNGVAALRQEAFRADRHFSNASNFV